MPRLSDSMEEGTILRWLVEDGASVSRGDEIVEIETDKATMTYEADADGVLSIVADEGATLPIGEVIARIGSDNGPPAERSEAGERSPAPVRQTTTPSAGDRSPTSEQAVSERPPSPPTGDGGERVKASPVARRVAR